jgi:hypothetical protein
MMVWMGLFPGAFLRRIDPSVQQLITIASRGTDPEIMLAGRAPAAPVAEAPAEGHATETGEPR